MPQATTDEPVPTIAQPFRILSLAKKVMLNNRDDPDAYHLFESLLFVFQDRITDEERERFMELVD